MYAHLSKRIVSAGEIVRQNDIIGYVGNTGTYSQGAHLHWELHQDGKPIDPKPWVGREITAVASGKTQSYVPNSGGTGGESDGLSEFLTGEDTLSQVFNLVFRTNMSSQLAEQFTGERAAINDEPLMNTIQSLTKGTLRSFQSSPTGDFVAFYPDYFGLMGTHAKVELEDVELKNLKIDLLDDPITTHVFTIGDTDGDGSIAPDNWLRSAGVITVNQEFVLGELIVTGKQIGRAHV